MYSDNTLARLTKAQKKTWDILKSKCNPIFPKKNATLKITKDIDEKGTVFIDDTTGQYICAQRCELTGIEVE